MFEPRVYLSLCLGLLMPQPLLQLRQRELTGIQDDFFRTAQDRVALVQSQANIYLFGTERWNGPLALAWRGCADVRLVFFGWTWLVSSAWYLPRLCRVPGLVAATGHRQLTISLSKSFDLSTGFPLRGPFDLEASYYNQSLVGAERDLEATHPVS